MSTSIRELLLNTTVQKKKQRQTSIQTRCETKTHRSKAEMDGGSQINSGSGGGSFGTTGS